MLEYFGSLGKHGLPFSLHSPKRPWKWIVACVYDEEPDIVGYSLEPIDPY